MRTNNTNNIKTFYHLPLPLHHIPNLTSIATSSISSHVAAKPDSFHSHHCSSNHSSLSAFYQWGYEGVAVTPLAFSVGRKVVYSSPLHATRRTRAHAMAARAGIDLEAFGKAKSGSGSPSKERGDCPFSQRIYIELEEKKLPYTATYIEEGDGKPDWFMEKNPKGLMPVLRDGEEWIQDSDKTAEHLETKYPEVSLATPQEFKQVGINIFQAFTSYLKSKNADDQSKDELLKELTALNEHLKTKGPYIAGENPTDSDYALIPKLHHLRVSLAHFMGFKIPSELTALHKYIELLESRPSFQKSNSPDDMIIQGWQKKFSLPDRVVESSKV